MKVTIPFAGFYCSEFDIDFLAFYEKVTIPFAGFYCSERCTMNAKNIWKSQSRSRDFIVLRAFKNGNVVFEMSQSRSRDFIVLRKP